MENALAAGKSTALRRRRSSTALPHPSQVPPSQHAFARPSLASTTDRREPGGARARAAEGEGGRGEGQGNTNDQDAAIPHPPATVPRKHDRSAKANHLRNSNRNVRRSRRQESVSWPRTALRKEQTQPQSQTQDSSSGLLTATNTPLPMVTAPESASPLPASSRAQTSISMPPGTEFETMTGQNLAHSQPATVSSPSNPDKSGPQLAHGPSTTCSSRSSTNGAPLDFQNFNTYASRHGGGQPDLSMLRPRPGSGSRSHGRELGLSPRRGVLKSGSLLSMTATKAAAEPRISVEAFEQFGGGNVAVYLSSRWRNRNSKSSSGESGFDMLARLALGEARPFLFPSSSSSSSSTVGGGRTGTGGGYNEQGWKKSSSDVQRLWLKGALSASGSAPPFPSFGSSGNKNNNNAHRWWSTGE